MLSIYGNFHLCCLPQAQFWPVTTMLWYLVNISPLWEESCGSPECCLPWFTFTYFSWHTLCEVSAVTELGITLKSLCLDLPPNCESLLLSTEVCIVKCSFNFVKCWEISEGTTHVFYVDMLDFISKLWCYITSFSLFSCSIYIPWVSAAGLFKARCSRVLNANRYASPHAFKLGPWLLWLCSSSLHWILWS